MAHDLRAKRERIVDSLCGKRQKLRVSWPMYVVLGADCCLHGTMLDEDLRVDGV
jgi:hypothetical protein